MTRTRPAAINTMAVSGPRSEARAGSAGPATPDGAGSIVVTAGVPACVGIVRSGAAEALPGDHVDAGQDEDRDRIADAEDGAGHGVDAEDAEAEHRQAERDQPAGDTADEEDHQQSEHLVACPAPAHGDRLADPQALDDDERADEREPSGDVGHRDECDQRHQHDHADEGRRLLGAADEDQGDRDADDDGGHDDDGQVLRLGARLRETRLEWQEGGRPQGGIVRRSLVVDLATLTPGHYRIEVTVATSGGGSRAAVRDLEVL